VIEPSLPLIPKLRGALHLIMSPIALVGGLFMIATAATFSGRISASVYTLASVVLFSVSAIYHRGNWNPRVKAILRRVDHANIALLIAGSYTPFAVLLLPHRSGIILLITVWGGALLSILFRLFWLGAPRWLYVPIYLALGWVAVIFLPTFWRKGGVVVFILIALGGLLYSAGGIIYALKRPNFSANWFGFHELFHAFTAAAFISQFIATFIVVLRPA
jgi:hemolysin III